MSAGHAERVDCVVLGAGVVGLAVARALALAGHEVLVLEAWSRPLAMRQAPGGHQRRASGAVAIHPPEGPGQRGG